jgi:hypothetical protein
MNIDGRRGVVNVVVVGSWRRDFHDRRNNNNGARALISVTEDFDVEEVSNRVAFRLFVRVDVDGIFHKIEIVPPPRLLHRCRSILDHSSPASPAVKGLKYSTLCAFCSV